MDKSKQAKLIELRKKKSADKKNSELSKHTQLIETINNLHSLFDNNSKKSYDYTDRLLSKLDEFSSFKNEVSKVREAIENIPKIDNVTVNNLSEIIESQQSIDLTEVIKAINALILVVKNQTVDSVTVKNKDTSEYIPVRRVRQVQGRLVFDDDPLQVTVAGGGGSRIGMLPFKDETGKAVQVELVGGKVPVEANIDMDAEGIATEITLAKTVGFDVNSDITTSIVVAGYVTTITKTDSVKTLTTTVDETNPNNVTISEVWS